MDSEQEKPTACLDAGRRTTHWARGTCENFWGGMLKLDVILKDLTQDFMVFGEAKIGNNGDFTKNQRPGIPEIASGKGTFYGTNAQSIAERLSVAPDANGRFRIPQSQIQGVYIGTYERDAPQNNKTRALNDAFRQSGGFGRGSD